MADNEDDGGSTRTITAAEPPGDPSPRPGESSPPGPRDQIPRPGESSQPTAAVRSTHARESLTPAAAEQSPQPGESSPAGSVLQSPQPGESSPAAALEQSPKPGESFPAAAVKQSPQPGESSPAAALEQSPKPGESSPAAAIEQRPQPGESSPAAAVEQRPQPGESSPAAAVLQSSPAGSLSLSCPGEQTLLLGPEFSSLGTDLGNTTILYVQPDGSLVEGSGLTAEEQQALLEQLTRQQIVQVSDTEAAQLLQQSQLIRTIPVQNTALDPTQLHPIKPPAVVTATPAQTAKPATARPAPVAPPPVVPPSVAPPTKEKKLKKREKKALKVQTRSGRVSRPPKYKAKDYKFIKTEDLADSHQSDSDDYSDMSVEDEEGARKDGSASGSSPSLTYSHKSRSHRCQTCDKAYIGAGGLNRHYKLNPTHGEPDPPGNTPRPLRDSQSQETTTEREPGLPRLRGLHHRGPGRPRGRGRGRGRRGRRGRPRKIAVTTVTLEQQAERRRDRLQELVEQCEDEELMDVVLPRLTKVLSLWELLLAKVEGGGPARTRFPDIYREFESLQAQVRQAAQDYIISPQGGAMPLEVRNIEVRRSASFKPLSRTQLSYLLYERERECNSKMLPPSKRFKMENSVSIHQNGIQTVKTGTTSTPVLLHNLPLVPRSDKVFLCSLSVSGSAPTQAPPPGTPMEVDPVTASQDRVLSSGDISAQMKELEKALGSSPEAPEKSGNPADSQTPEPGLEGQEIYIQTEGLTVQMAEPGLDRIVIVNGPDGTTMHIQTPEGVPLEAVQALLGIEASDAATNPQ
uniref:Zinc finger protein 839 n=1 Tax=Sander lucioperca TaxID=283035 RepID=A0A8C9XG61_SANLU